MEIAKDTIRIDQLLWRLRFAKTRGIAQKAVAQNHIRINGRRVLRDSAAVRVGDIITMPYPDNGHDNEGVKIISWQLEIIPMRRGPAIEAQSCYIFLGD